MRIEALEVRHLKVPLAPPLGGSAARPAQPFRGLLVIAAHGEGGCIGYGESYGTPASVAAIVEEVLAPVVLGRDALDVEVLWHEMYRKIGYHGPGGIMLEALSGLDLALWDLKGKALNAPASVLLGGYRPRIEVYAASIYLDQPAAMAEQARRFAELGWPAMKLKVGEDAERDLAAVAAVRSAVSPPIKVMVDANGAYDRRTAIRVGRQLDKLGIAWLEEPVATQDFEGYARVAEALDLPIAGGEGHYTRWGFRDLIQRGQVDVLQPDLTRCGGLSEARAIAWMGSAHGRSFSPHCWSSVFGLAAAVQLASAAPNTLNVEYDAHPNPIKERLLGPQLTPEAGVLDVPTAPGLGIEVDTQAMEQMTVARKLIAPPSASRQKTA